MDHFQYRDGAYFAEDVPVRDIAAQAGTPCYVYSRATLERHWRAIDHAFGGWPHQICYAVKSNANLAVLNLLARLGSGFDIVSAGELGRVIAAGGDPAKVVFSGVGKTAAEMRYAMEQGIRCFNVESVSEFERLDRLAGEAGCVVDVAFRVNPDVDAETHPYISTGLKENKFGIPVEDAFDVYQQAAESANLNVSGVACHIGSQLTRMDPFEDAFGRVLEFVSRLGHAGIELDHVDFGGGLGVQYKDETPPHPALYVERMLDCMRKFGCELPVMIEPGRVISANAGIFLTEIQYLKTSGEFHFAVVDGAMNDMLRPALYQAWLDILPAELHGDAPARVYDVVGPICESSDFLGKRRELAINEGDLLVVRSAGAYGSVMSSNYNARSRPLEVMVDGDQWTIVRERESLAQMIQGEHILP